MCSKSEWIFLRVVSFSTTVFSQELLWTGAVEMGFGEYSLQMVTTSVDKNNNNDDEYFNIKN
jgi:hypothetical protein